MNRRGDNYGKDMEVLFDFSLCQHPDNCDCPLQNQVPITWKAFLADQRKCRSLEGVLCPRVLSLRSKEREELENRERVRLKVEENERKAKSKKEQEEKSKQDIEILLNTAPMDNIFEDEDLHSEEIEDDNSKDSDWEDIEEDIESEKYNTMSLKNFARECDRYCVSDRSAAKIANGLLKDLKLVKRGNTNMLICPSKVRRERAKWGAKFDKESRSAMLPGGLYTDGKRVPTLVRQTTVTKVQVPGGRGRSAYRTVCTTNNKMVVEDHYPVLAEPGGSYVTHVTPEDGTGVALARELVAVIRERKAPTRVIGMDGCSVNTGIHNGAIRQVEVMLQHVVQHAICGLHLNELLFWHIISETDGVTKGPDCLSGPVGSTLHTDLWLQPVVAFKSLVGKVETLADSVVAGLSRDQLLAYRYAKAIQTGHMPDDLVNQVIGPLCSSRWNTAATRIMCKYTRTKKPTKGLIRLTKAALNLYLPGWFKYKSSPHIQEGARNYFFLVELSRSLVEEDKNIAFKVLQDNSYWAHSENITISML